MSRSVMPDACATCGKPLCDLDCPEYVEWMRNREPRRNVKMAMEPDTANLLEAFSRCANALAELKPEYRNRVINALQQLYPSADFTLKFSQGWKNDKIGSQ